MIFSPGFINLKNNKLIAVDEFIEKALYHPIKGYYSKKVPFGSQGDFITAPTLSNLFSEIIGIWLISTWEKMDKPERLNFVELGPGDGSLAKVLVNIFEKFPEFNKAIKIFLYEKSELLKKIQKNKIKNSNIKWIDNFDSINKGPIIFFGNEFFDAIPIKQFSYFKKKLFEKFYIFNSKTGLSETYREASKKNIKKIKSFKTLNDHNFIEYPQLGFLELEKMVNKVSKLSGGILLIDYGYLDIVNTNTLQAVMGNKKININTLFKNPGKADITYLVNFSLLKEFFIKKSFKVENIVSQKFFLEKMGILERAKILKKRMTFKEEERMSHTLKRLLHKKSIGELFKVIFAYKSRKNNFLGFE